MVTFRRFTSGFVILLLATSLWGLLLDGMAAEMLRVYFFPIALSLTCAWFGISIAFAFMPCSGFHHPVLCRGNTVEKTVSITFDDGPDPANTPGILEVLARHQVRATFFCIGRKIRGQKDLLDSMHREGHLLGNHSYSHSGWFDLFTPRRMRREFLETDRLLAAITGSTTLFFRPPYGVINPMVSEALRGMHWTTVCWSIRSYDTLKQDPRKIIRRIISGLKPGSIILLHDATPFAGEHLDELLLQIQDSGYRIVPLDKMLNLPAYGKD